MATETPHPPPDLAAAEVERALVLAEARIQVDRLAQLMPLIVEWAMESVEDDDAGA